MALSENHFFLILLLEVLRLPSTIKRTFTHGLVKTRTRVFFYGDLFTVLSTAVILSQVLATQCFYVRTKPLL